MRLAFSLVIRLDDVASQQTPTVSGVQDNCSALDRNERLVIDANDMGVLKFNPNGFPVEVILARGVQYAKAFVLNEVGQPRLLQPDQSGQYRLRRILGF